MISDAASCFADNTAVAGTTGCMVPFQAAGISGGAGNPSMPSWARGSTPPQDMTNRVYRGSKRCDILSVRMVRRHEI